MGKDGGAIAHQSRAEYALTNSASRWALGSAGGALPSSTAPSAKGWLCAYPGGGISIVPLCGIESALEACLLVQPVDRQYYSRSWRNSSSSIARCATGSADHSHHGRRQE